MTKKILILGAGIYQVPLIKKAKEMGYYTIVASYKGNYPGFTISDKNYYIDTTDYLPLLEISKNEKIDAILTTGTDVPIITLGKISENLHLPGISFNSAMLATNKFEMKKAFIKNDVSTARFEIVKTLKEVYSAYEKLQKPVIFKATDSSGSRGIVIVEKEEEIKKAYNLVFETTKKDYFIIEEFIEGIEFGAQAFVYQGKIKFILPHGDILFKGKTNVPIGHYAPYNDLSDNHIQQIQKELEKVVTALSLDTCAINADFILKNDTVYVLEIGARAGATCLVELVSLYYGFDYYEKLILASLGENPDFPQKKKQPNASLLLTSNKTGIIRSIKNTNLPNPNIIDISFDYGIGDKVRKFNVGPDRIGQIITIGNTVEEAIDLLHIIKNNIEIEIEEQT